MSEDEVEKVLLQAKKRAEDLDLKTVVVASTSGKTGYKVAEVFEGYKVVVDTHSTGFTAPDAQELTGENQERILKAGGRYLRLLMLLAD